MTKLFSVISKWKENTDQLFHNKGIVRERIWANGMAKIQLIVQKENMTAKLLTHQAVHKIIFTDLTKWRSKIKASTVTLQVV